MDHESLAAKSPDSGVRSGESPAPRYGEGRPERAGSNTRRYGAPTRECRKCRYERVYPLEVCGYEGCEEVHVMYERHDEGCER